MSAPLLRRLGLVLSLALIGGFAGLTYAVKAPPRYTARAYVATTGSDAVIYARAYARVATSGPVLARATALLGPDPSGLDRVTATAPPSTPVVEVAARARSAARAATVANAVARALTGYGTSHEPALHVGLTVLAPATVPVRPSSPSLACSLTIGTSAGLLAGALAALLTLGQRRVTLGRRRARPRFRPAFVHPIEIEGHLRAWRARPSAPPAGRSGTSPAGHVPHRLRYVRRG